MKLVTLSFDSPSDFLAHYSEADLKAVYFRTRTELEVGEELIMDIRFPTLVEPAIIRGSVVKLDDDGGWLRFDEDAPLAFLLAVAKGTISEDEQRARSHARFPVDVPVVCRIDGHSDDEHLITQTIDLGAGGAFVRADEGPLPEVGSRVRMLLGPTKGTKESFVVFGKVAWCGSAGDGPAFGVKFGRATEDTKRLRNMLRRTSEMGEVVFAQ